VALSARRPEANAVWIDRPSQLDALVEEGLAAGEVALDTEFHRERTYYPRLALVQVAIGERVWLVDPLAVGIEPFAAWLAGDAVELVLHAAEQDIEILERAVGQRPRRVFDTQVAAGFLGVGHASLGALLERFLGVSISKAERTSDWLRRPLELAQLAYAANDVRYLAELRDVLVADLRARGREGWARSEMERLIERRRREVEPELAWVRVRECRGLDPRSLRVAAQVAAWRERVAQEQDVPVRTILSDLGVASVAKVRPRSLTELRSVRGIDGRMPKERAEALLAVVARASEGERTIPRGSARMERQLEPGEVPLVLAVQAFVHQVALELELEPSLLATREDVELFVARGEGALTEGWRHDVVGRAVRALLAGELSVTVREGRLRVEEH
jgi:ribonuclease D